MLGTEVFPPPPPQNLSILGKYFASRISVCSAIINICLGVLSQGGGVAQWQSAEAWQADVPCFTAPGASWQRCEKSSLKVSVVTGLDGRQVDFIGGNMWRVAVYRVIPLTQSSPTWCPPIGTAAPRIPNSHDRWGILGIAVLISPSA